jgi:predicted lipoprotein with Yx(FWY)xxD motif
MRHWVIALVAILALAAAATATAATRSSSVGTRSTSLGTIVVDSKSRTLYAFGKDTSGKSACSGTCAAAWPPAIVTGTPTAGSGVKKSLISTTRRSNGARQLTYGGHPLYGFVMDANKPGSVKGQGVSAFGSTFHVVAPSGKPIG